MYYVVTKFDFFSPDREAFAYTSTLRAAKQILNGLYHDDRSRVCYGIVKVKGTLPTTEKLECELVVEDDGCWPKTKSEWKKWRETHSCKPWNE